jgi:hypothetical protein
MSDLSKEHLYEGVKLLVETETNKIHLNQPKLYTLMSLGFQYLLYLSTKNPGAYLIRLEDSLLADKLMKKSKDPSTRKFLAKLLTTRKLNYGQSSFYLDYFHPQSWQVTQTVASAKWKASLVVKGTSNKTFIDLPEYDADATSEHVMEKTAEAVLNPFDENVYLAPLCALPIKTLWIAFDNSTPPEFTEIKFPFIPDKEEPMLGGVTVASEIKNKIL